LERAHADGAREGSQTVLLRVMPLQLLPRRFNPLGILGELTVADLACPDLSSRTAGREDQREDPFVHGENVRLLQ
jgi:hypothetical protein